MRATKNKKKKKNKKTIHRGRNIYDDTREHTARDQDGQRPHTLRECWKKACVHRLVLLMRHVEAHPGALPNTQVPKVLLARPLRDYVQVRRVLADARYHLRRV